MTPEGQKTALRWAFGLMIGGVLVAMHSFLYMVDWTTGCLMAGFTLICIGVLVATLACGD